MKEIIYSSEGEIIWKEQIHSLTVLPKPEDLIVVNGKTYITYEYPVRAIDSDCYIVSLYFVRDFVQLKNPHDTPDSELFYKGKLICDFNSKLEERFVADTIAYLNDGIGAFDKPVRREDFTVKPLKNK